MNVASRSLCQKLYEFSGWGDPDTARPLAETPSYWPDQYWCQEVKDAEWTIYTEITDHTMWGNQHYIPAYDADYVAAMVRNYDFTIVNLNTRNFSLVSDSLDDPEAAILGSSLAELLTEFATELFRQGILIREPTS